MAIICVMGVAPCLEKDLENLSILAPCCIDYMAVGLDCSDRVVFDIQHMVTYHVDELPQFRSRREKAGGNTNYKTHSFKPPADMVWPLVAKSPLSGSSAFLGCQAAIGMGYKRVVLCGCPMQGKNLLKPKAHNYDAFQKGWIKYAPQMFGDKVKSMSGWTKDFLGEPTRDWLEGQGLNQPIKLVLTGQI